jgi:hypothetical protein
MTFEKYYDFQQIQQHFIFYLFLYFMLFLIKLLFKEVMIDIKTAISMIRVIGPTYKMIMVNKRNKHFSTLQIAMQK